MWASAVEADRAHNPKVAGSNPAPATNFRIRSCRPASGAVFVPVFSKRLFSNIKFLLSWPSPTIIMARFWHFGSPILGRLCGASGKLGAKAGIGGVCLDRITLELQFGELVIYLCKYILRAYRQPPFLAVKLGYGYIGFHIKLASLATMACCQFDIVRNDMVAISRIAYSLYKVDYTKFTT
jgi:hypothetical protein